jgi:hypothetical protein
VWGADANLEPVLAFLPAAGWTVNINQRQGPVGTAGFEQPGTTGWRYGDVWMREIYTPSGEISALLRQALDDEVKRLQRDEDPASSYAYQVRSDSVQPRLIGGNQALSCIIDYIQVNGQNHNRRSNYLVWIRTENTFIKFTVYVSLDDGGVGVARWKFDPVLATAKIP